MGKRKKLIFIIALILIIALVLISIVMIKPKKQKEDGECYIHIRTIYTPPETYTFKMGNNGNFSIKVSKSSSTIEQTSTEYELKGTFTNEESKMIKDILNNVKKSSQIVEQKKYWFYLDEDEDDGSVLTQEDYYTIIYCMSAIESIAQENIIMIDANEDYSEYEDSMEYDVNNDGKITQREFGDAFLKNIIKELD